MVTAFHRILYYGWKKSVRKFDLSKIVCIFPNLNFVCGRIGKIGLELYYLKIVVKCHAVTFISSEDNRESHLTDSLTVL